MKSRNGICLADCISLQTDSSRKRAVVAVIRLIGNSEKLRFTLLYSQVLMHYGSTGLDGGVSVCYHRSALLK
jgi:hypothetical protein